MATQIINLNEHLQTSVSHKEFFQSTARRVLFYGSKGSGKSYSVADKLLIQPGIQSQIAKKDIWLKTVVIRQSLPSLKRSCIELLQERADLFKIPYHLNKSDYIAEYGPASKKSKIIFIGLDDAKAYQKLQSITNVDIVWIEELPEVTERVYENADLILRGGKGLYKQFIGTFNPVSIGSWVFNRWWERKADKIHIIPARAEDNRFIDKEYLQTLKDLEFSNKSLWKVYYLGEWGILKGIIYDDNIDIVKTAPANYDEIIYGLDFGYNVPSALVKMYLKQIDTTQWEVWCQQKLYKTELTNTKLVRELKSLKIERELPIYCDCAEPDKIQELCDAGFNAKPCDKEAKPKVQIDFCKSQKIHYLEDSSDLIKERSGYVWAEDKNGKPTDEPVKFQDHLMDGKRYGLFTHLRRFVDVNIRTV